MLVGTYETLEAVSRYISMKSHRDFFVNKNFHEIDIN